MKKNLNVRRMIPATLLILFVLACGGVYAYMFMRTGVENTQFVPAEVSCEISEQVSGNQKTAITVTNTGNVKAYLRVRLVSYWVDGSGSVVAKNSEMPEVTPAAQWLKSASGATCYYTLPVDPMASVQLLGAPITLTEEDGCKQVVEVFAEAIQAEPTKAVTTSWGVGLSGTTISTVP